MDADHLAATMASVVADDKTADPQSLPYPRRKTGHSQWKQGINGPSGDRTRNLGLKRPLLCRLS
jgi:hypothetical protein